MKTNSGFYKITSLILWIVNFFICLFLFASYLNPLFFMPTILAYVRSFMCMYDVYEYFQKGKTAVFTIKQIYELKEIIEDSDVNNAIEYIDDIISTQDIKEYVNGRVLY